MSAGLCQCGCGQQTRIAPVTDRAKGWIKGQPLKFIKGHNAIEAHRAKSAKAIGNRTMSSHGYVVVCTHEYHVALHHRLEASPAWPEFQPVTRNQKGNHHA